MDTNEYRTITITLPMNDLTMHAMANAWTQIFDSLPADGTWQGKDELLQNILFVLQDTAIELHGLYPFANYLMTEFDVKRDILVECFDVPNLQGNE